MVQCAGAKTQIITAPLLPLINRLYNELVIGRPRWATASQVVTVGYHRYDHDIPHE